MVRIALIIVVVLLGVVGAACGGSSNGASSSSAEQAAPQEQAAPSTPACLETWNGSDNSHWQDYLAKAGYPDVGYGEAGDGTCVIVAIGSDGLSFIGFANESGCEATQQAPFCLTDVSPYFPQTDLGYPDFSGMTPASMASDGKLS